MRNHTVVIGYGTKGKTAVAAMCGDEAASKDFVVVDIDQSALDHAAAADLVTVHGDATRSDVLRLASAQHASAIIVATGRDDTATLVTLTAREKSPPTPKSWRRSARPKTSTCSSNPGPTRWSSPPRPPADCSVWPSTTPSVVEMIDDLLTPSHGFAIAERDVEQTELGGSPRHLPDIVLGVVRDGHLLRVDAPEADAIEAGDRLLYVRNTGK